MVVSVVVLVHNSAKTIRKCLEAILSQTHVDFELVIVDDYSQDNTVEIIKSYDDARIRIIRNEKNLGIAKSRNVGLRNCKGDLVFFTDSDCIPALTWLQEGVKNIGDFEFITGWTLYETARPSFKHRVVQGRDSFYTCNLGFKKAALEAIGGFDENFAMWAEDKDVCFRILKNGGKKTYCGTMFVVHQTTLKTAKSEMKNYANYYCGKVLSEINHGKENGVYFRVMRPDALFTTIFPPALLITESFKSWHDFKLLPFTWLGMARGRFKMWQQCARMKKFYI
jgi:glycosyltransferase involved in cell wall biosynthesis